MTDDMDFEKIRSRFSDKLITVMVTKMANEEADKLIDIFENKFPLELREVASKQSIKSMAEVLAKHKLEHGDSPYVDLHHDTMKERLTRYLRGLFYEQEKAEE